MFKATNVKFGRPIHRDRLNKCPYSFFSEKGARPCHMTPKFYKLPPNISGMGKATNIKFGTYIHSDRLNKAPLLFFPKKGRGPGHVTPKIFRVPLISQEWVKLRTYNLVCLFTVIG